MPQCRSSQHFWEDKGDASRCCNGWTYIRVPLGYGATYFGKTSYTVDKHCKLWEPYLIPDSNRKEILRILESTPVAILGEKN